MQTVKHAVISAAGMGSRLEMNIPKCLVDIGNRKIIDYQLELLRDIENVRIVVGFMEEKVIDYVKGIRDDVIFVRNPNYRTTSNCYSVHLATYDLEDPFMIIDGDLLINQKSFHNFLTYCNGTDTIIGITEGKTEEAVFVELDEDDSHIVSFTRETAFPYEWSGIAYLKDINISKNANYIFHELEKYLPLRSVDINCYEIDTPEDLSKALSHFKF